MWNTEAEIKEQQIKAFEGVMFVICYLTMCVLIPLAVLIAFVLFIGVI